MLKSLRQIKGTNTYPLSRPFFPPFVSMSFPIKKKLMTYHIPSMMWVNPNTITRQSYKILTNNRFFSNQINISGVMFICCYLIHLPLKEEISLFWACRSARKIASLAWKRPRVQIPTSPLFCLRCVFFIRFIVVK